jgi:hypothetical protein
MMYSLIELTPILILDLFTRDALEESEQEPALQPHFFSRRKG